MNKKQLASQVALISGLNKTQSEKAVNAMIKAITEALMREERVSLSGLGTFEVRTRAPRKGRNPMTNEEIVIPETKTPAFRVSSSLRSTFK